MVYADLDAANDEIQRMVDLIYIESTHDLNEYGKLDAHYIIKELRSKLSAAQEETSSARLSRDTMQNELAKSKVECKMLRDQLKKLKR